MGRSKHSGPGARNLKGIESEQSKKRRKGERKSDMGDPGSTAGKLATSRKKKQKELDKVMGK